MLCLSRHLDRIHAFCTPLPFALRLAITALALLPIALLTDAFAAERMHPSPARVHVDTTEETAFHAARRLSALTKAATAGSASSGGHQELGHGPQQIHPSQKHSPQAGMNPARPLFPLKIASQL